MWRTWMETIPGLGKISFCARAQCCKKGKALPKGVWGNVGDLSYPRNCFLPDLLGEQLQSPWELVLVISFLPLQSHESMGKEQALTSPDTLEARALSFRSKIPWRAVSSDKSLIKPVPPTRQKANARFADLP